MLGMSWADSPWEDRRGPAAVALRSRATSAANGGGGGRAQALASAAGATRAHRRQGWSPSNPGAGHRIDVPGKMLDADEHTLVEEDMAASWSRRSGRAGR